HTCTVHTHTHVQYTYTHTHTHARARSPPSVRKSLLFTICHEGHLTNLAALAVNLALGTALGTPQRQTSASARPPRALRHKRRPSTLSQHPQSQHIIHTHTHTHTHTNTHTHTHTHHPKLSTLTT